jgi:hypothetical protein
VWVVPAVRGLSSFSSRWQWRVATRPRMMVMRSGGGAIWVTALNISQAEARAHRPFSPRMVRILGGASPGRLAAKGRRLGRRLLRQVATLVTPDTILRWHRHLIARKWTFTPKRPGRPGVMKEISTLIVRMATENSAWGYTRIQGALKNLGHDVARSTVAKVLKDHGIPPAPDRPSSWRTFLRAHWARSRGPTSSPPRSGPREDSSPTTRSSCSTSEADGFTWPARRPPRMAASWRRRLVD